MKNKTSFHKFMESKAINVELGAIDDIKARAGALQKDLSRALAIANENAKLKNEATKILSSLTDTISAQQKDINKAAASLKELGMDTNILKYYNDQVGEILQESKSISKRMAL